MGGLMSEWEGGIIGWMPRGRLVLAVVVLVLATAVAGTIARAGATAPVGLPASMAGTPPLVPKEPPGPGSHFKVVKCIYFFWRNHRLYRIHAQVYEPVRRWSSLHATRVGARWDVKPNSRPEVVATFTGAQAPQRATNFIYRYHPWSPAAGVGKCPS